MFILSSICALAFSTPDILTSSDIYFSGSTPAWDDHICVVCPDSGSVRPIYTDSSRRTDDARISPSGQCVGFLSRSREVDEWPAVLVVLSADGNVWKRVEGIVDFSWSPDSLQLALVEVVKDTETEKATRVSVLTLGNDLRRRICDGGRRVHWAVFDDAIYVKGPFPADEVEVRRYDVKAKSWENTKYADINFSPNGHWYYTRQYETPVEVLDSVTQENILPERRPGYRPVQGLRWLCENLVSLSYQPKRNYVFECTTRNVRGVPGLAVGASSDGKEVRLLITGKCLITVPLSDLPIVAGPGAPVLADPEKK